MKRPDLIDYMAMIFFGAVLVMVLAATVLEFT